MCAAHPNTAHRVLNRFVVHTEVSYARGEVEELPPGVSSLVDAALGGDDPGRLMAAAGRELRTPIGLVSRSGYPLGWAPRDGDGQRALAVAEAAARSGLVAPPGWRIVPLSVGASALGFLAVGGQPAWLDLVVALLAEQLYRAELVRARVAGRVRRLVGEPAAGRPAARRAAAGRGRDLADADWAAVTEEQRASVIAHPQLYAQAETTNA